MFKTASTPLAVVLVLWYLSYLGYAQTVAPSNPTLAGAMGINSDTLISCMAGGFNLLPECYDASTGVEVELSELGVRGDLIARARMQTLEILSSDNECAEWLETVEPDIADVFRSLHYDIDTDGTAEIQSVRDRLGDLYFKHPWGARSMEGSGRDAFIELNGNGPFFVHKTHVALPEAQAAAFRIDAPHPVYIGPYVGASSEARVTILLHELGHIVGRLPKDDDSWNGRSPENTREVLRHCAKEIRQVARRGR